MLRTTLGTLICAVSLLLSFYSAAHGELMVSKAKVRTFLPASESSVGYLTLMNHSDHDRVLKKVEIETLGRVEIHTHEHKNGMMQMRKRRVTGSCAPNPGISTRWTTLNAICAKSETGSR